MQRGREHQEQASTAKTKAGRGPNTAKTRSRRGREHNEDASAGSTRTQQRREHSETARTTKTGAQRSREQSDGASTTSTRAPGARERSEGAGTARTRELRGREHSKVSKTTNLKKSHSQTFQISFGFCILARLSLIQKTKRVDGGSLKAANLKKLHASKSFRALSDFVYCRASPHSKKLSGWTGKLKDCKLGKF